MQCVEACCTCPALPLTPGRFWSAPHTVADRGPRQLCSRTRAPWPASCARQDTTPSIIRQGQHGRVPALACGGCMRSSGTSCQGAWARAETRRPPPGLPDALGHAAKLAAGLQPALAAPAAADGAGVDGDGGGGDDTSGGACAGAGGLQALLLAVADAAGGGAARPAAAALQPFLPRLLEPLCALAPGRRARRSPLPTLSAISPH